MLGCLPRSASVALPPMVLLLLSAVLPFVHGRELLTCGQEYQPPCSQGALTDAYKAMQSLPYLLDNTSLQAW